MMRRLIHEPLVHFLGVGALLFVVHGGGKPETAPGPDAVIEVAPAQIRQLTTGFEATWRRAPSPDEVAALLDEHVREEIYYREALALGLDQDDVVVRRRLRQKMEFIAAGAVVAPDEAALRAHHAAYGERFSQPARVTFRQVALEDDREASAVRAALEGGLDPLAAGRPGLLPSAMEAASEATVDGVFGAGFFEGLARLSAGSWQGPVQSAYGPHLVEILSFEPGGVAPFEAVRDRVEEDWRRAAAEAAREAHYAALRARYEVVLPQEAQ